MLFIVQVVQKNIVQKLYEEKVEYGEKEHLCQSAF
jgi:hypothetical protein